MKKINNDMKSLIVMMAFVLAVLMIPLAGENTASFQTGKNDDIYTQADLVSEIRNLNRENHYSSLALASETNYSDCNRADTGTVLRGDYMNYTDSADYMESGDAGCTYSERNLLYIIKEYDPEVEGNNISDPL